MVPMFDLTPFTSRRAKQAARTIVIQRMEVNYRLGMVIVFSATPGVMLAALFWPLLREASLLLMLLAVVAGWFLFYRSTRSGLRLRTYQTLRDRVMAKNGELYVGGRIASVDPADLRILIRNSVPRTVAAAGAAGDDIDDLLGGPAPLTTAPADLSEASWPSWVDDARVGTLQLDGILA